MGTVGLLGLLTTAVATFSEYSQLRDIHQARFQRQADAALVHAQQASNNYIVLLQSISSFFDASTYVDRDEFRTFVQSFGLEQNFPGVTAAGYIPVAGMEDVPNLEAMARKQGLEGFKLEQPIQQGGKLAPVWYVEPFSGSNMRLLGRNFLANPVLAEAMGQARDTGHEVMSGPVKLVNEWGEGQPLGVVVFYPIYHKQSMRFTQDQRASALQGYAFAALRINDIFSGVGDGLGVDLEVYDGNKVDVDRLLFDTDAHRKQGHVTKGRFAELLVTSSHAHRQWTWYLGTLPSFEAEIDLQPTYVIALGGLATTVLVVALVGYLGLGRQRAQAIALEMTGQLHEQNQVLRESLQELEFQKAVLDAHAIVSVADAQGRILYVNKLFSDISGYGKEELLGQNHRLLKSGRHDPAFYERMWSTIAMGEIWQGELCNRTKDGREYWVQSTIVPFLDENGVPMRYLSARTDITALKQAQEELSRHRDRLHELVEARTEELRRAKEVAEAASRAKSEFLANMSHELRTPMHAVLSYSELGEGKAGQEGVAPDKLKNYFQRIHQSGHRLLHLINELLDLSKMEAGRMSYALRQADLRPLIIRIGENLAGLMTDKGLTLDMKDCSGPSVAVFDTLRMEQVFTNLLSNAIRFSPQGGVITIQCETVAIHGRRTDDGTVPGIRIAISDQGPGIPETELESVFEPFVQSSQTKNGAGGTGLGLPICRQILNAHRGRIWAENPSSGGARIVFEFPANLSAG